MFRFVKGLLLPLGLLLTAASDLPPTAQIVKHGMIFPDAPVIRIGFPKHAVYAGADHFILYDIADCEIQLFVEAGKDRVVHRYWWLQRESYVPGRPDLTHDYRNGAKDAREMRWGLGVWVRPRFGPTGTPENRGSDSAHVRDLLIADGYTLPPEMMSVRLVHLLDEKSGDGHGRAELMIIYAEDAAAIGLQPDDPRWAAMAKALTDRAEQSLTVSVASRP